MSGKRLILIHGAGIKPDATAYQDLWLAALRAGLVRDHPAAAQLFDSIQSDFVYYGDLTNAIVRQPWDATLDLEDRKLALANLVKLTKSKNFRRANYEALPGQSPLKEFAADVAAPLTHGLGLGKLIKGRVVPDLGAYWDDTNGFASTINERISQVVRQALGSAEQTMIISHCLGSVGAYNSLWQLSQNNPEAAALQRCNVWLTLGSPLADETVKGQLQGQRAKLSERYPNNMVRWFNVAAEDDYFCHDETVANDFKRMLSQHQIAEITDFGIYNLAVRYGRSDPHHSAGYLVHPRTSRILADWLLDR